jgi:N-acetylmuramoyl-L-alanine amidase
MPEKRYIICLDPGHGGKDPGACGNGLEEKDITLRLSQLVKAELNSYLVEVVMTRSEDVYVSLEERVRIANQKKANLFLSIHINAGGGTGFESYRDIAAGAETIRYQNIIHDAVKSIGDRGKKVAVKPRFYVLQHTEMPALLLENLFIDNKVDAVFLKDIGFLKRLAEAISDGVVKALDLKSRTYDPEPIWDARLKEIERLKERGLINSDHDPNAPVSWGEFATVLNRLWDEKEGECKCNL